MQIDLSKMGQESDFLPISTVAQVLNLSRQKIYLMLNNGELSSYDFSGVKRIRKKELEIFIKKSKE